MENRIKELKEEIRIQGEVNVELYNSVPLATKEDPLGEKAEPILQQWREGSRKIKQLINELNQLEIEYNKQNKKHEPDKSIKTFVNGYGEATDREITTSSYKKQQKKLSKQILSFMGN